MTSDWLRTGTIILDDVSKAITSLRNQTADKHVFPHVKCRLLLAHFNQHCNGSISFREAHRYRIS
jgi:hypothetical protein